MNSTRTRQLVLVIILIIAVAVVASYFISRRTQQQQLTNQLVQENTMGSLRFTSSSFEHEGRIPAEFTCQGRNVNPPLSIAGVPTGTSSLVLIMDDPDAPAGVWDHWVVWNIKPDTTDIAAASVPTGAMQGKNSWGRSDYGGPCPPAGVHRYRFTVYAISDVLSLAPGSDKQTVLRVIEGKILDSFTLIGLYGKSS